MGTGLGVGVIFLTDRSSSEPRVLTGQQKRETNLSKSRRQHQYEARGVIIISEKKKLRFQSTPKSIIPEKEIPESI